MNNQNATQSPESLSFQKTSSLPNAIELLKQSLNIYKQNLKVFSIIIFVLTFIGFFAKNLSAFYLIKNKLNISIFLTLLIGIGILLVIFIFSILTFYALLYLIKNGSEKIGFIEAYYQSFKILVPGLWLYFLLSLIILGALALFLIPGIIFGIWFMFLPYILVNENLKGMDALLKSREYVRGYWWRVFWRLIIVLILITIVYLPFLFLSPKTFISENVYQFIINLIWSFFFSLQTIYIFMLYRSLQFIKGKFNFQPLIVQKIQFINIGILGILVIINIFFDISVDILTLFSKFLI